MVSPKLTPQFLTDYARLCEPRLREFLDRKGAALPAELQPAHILLRDYALRGGKRIRGGLVHLTGGDAAIDASVGMELLHTYLLIHDDFMDRDETRRGGPTLHVSLGANLAILLGSLCEAWAFELVLAAPHGREVAQVLAAAVQEVIAGQALDVLAPAGPELVPEQVARIQRMKTGSYTFELPLKLGATIAGAPPEMHLALERYGRPLGQAFQIIDDLLGTFGSPEVTGKPNASDLREGKRTLLIARALASATPEDAAVLRKGLGDPGADVEKLRAILRRSGAVDAARADAEKLRDQALRELASLPPQLAEHLREIALFSLQRVF